MKNKEFIHYPPVAVIECNECEWKKQVKLNKISPEAHYLVVKTKHKKCPKCGSENIDILHTIRPLGVKE